MDNELLSLNVWSIPKHVSVNLEKSWESFLGNNNMDQDLSVRPLIKKSWERCLHQGINPLHNKAPLHLSEAHIQNYFSDNNYLLSSIEPVLNNLKVFAKDSGHLLVFCDPNGHIVHIDGCPSLQDKAGEMNFLTGSSWSENNAGTNAIGTAISIQKPVQIFSAEHFCQEVHQWTCSAAPVRDPITRKIIGVIDLTGLREDIHPHSLSVVIAAAQSAEESLRKQLEFERFKVLEYYLETLSRSPNSPWAVLDRGFNVLKASSSLYEEEWVDTKNRLVGCPINSFQDLSEQNWLVEGRKGTWRFILRTCFDEGRPIGAIVHVISPTKKSRAKTANMNPSATKYSFASFIGRAPKFLSAVSDAHSAAGSDFPVLIEGESGSGKELFAQAIHAASRRFEKPFVSVNCGAIPKELATSEFFGFVGGSFTGAAKEGRSGKFEQADGGTLFLDEIGEMPLDLQTLLLRVLEEGEVVRLGGRTPIQVDVRVIAATNRDLLTYVEKGSFRRDLYYRLNVLAIRVPSLKDRPEDIMLLMQHFLQKACSDLGRLPPRISDEAIRVLKTYEWPGNVRELRNLAYRSAVNATSNTLDVMDLPWEIRDKKMLSITSNHKHVITNSGLKDQELEMIRSALKETQGNVTQAAKRLGINRSTIYRKMGSKLSEFRQFK